MLVEQVTRTHIFGAELEYRIVCAAGPANKSWAEFFRDLAAPDKQRLADAEITAVVAVLETFAATITLTENNTISVFTCSFPAPDLFPSPTLFPC